MPYNKDAFKKWSNDPDVRVRRNAYLREWCKKNPEKRFMRYLRTRLKKKYGMTIAEYNLMLERQDFKCGICKANLEITTQIDRVRNGKSVVVDHDKITNRVRGLLCNNCNRAIGLLDHDVLVIESAQVWLKDRT